MDQQCEDAAVVGVGYELSCGHVDVWYWGCAVHGFYFRDLLMQTAPALGTRIIPIEEASEHRGHLSG